MHSRRQRDEDDVDLWIVAYTIEAFVVVEVLRGDAIFGREAARLRRVAADQRRDARAVAVSEGGEDVLLRKAAETDDRPAKFLSDQRTFTLTWTP
jgi:hypothetical protein